MEGRQVYNRKVGCSLRMFQSQGHRKEEWESVFQVLGGIDARGLPGGGGFKLWLTGGWA